MSNSSEKTCYLLDKNVARYAIAGLHYGRLRPLLPVEMGALAFWRTVEQQHDALFISHASFHVLRRLAEYAEVQALLDSVTVLWPTRYYTRWTRRIRATTGLSREDCAEIAVASFGTDSGRPHLRRTQPGHIRSAARQRLPKSHRCAKPTIARHHSSVAPAFQPGLASRSGNAG